MAFRSPSDVDNAIRQACQRYIESEAPLHREQVLAWLTDPTLLTEALIRTYTEAAHFMAEPQFEDLVAHAVLNPAEALESGDSGDENFGIIPSFSRLRSRNCTNIDILATRTT